MTDRHPDSGSRQTLLVLQFGIEFADIWAQYSPSTYTSNHTAFFDLCPNVQMAGVTFWKYAKFSTFSPLAPEVWEIGDPKRLTRV